MKWFKGLEGARAWLAWIVVASHIVVTSQLVRAVPVLHQLQAMGDLAVNVFIVISGFVIAHLILSKREPYGLYVFRRFMRIYPVYVVCLCLGVFATLLFNHMAASQPWGGDLQFTPRMQRAAASLQGSGFYAHLAAHLTLLHGAISGNRLLESEYAFLSPAWSLSLEWQFYLVAPLVMLALQRQGTAALAVLVAILAALAYQRGSLGSFILPSFLPGAVFQFAAGIATRLMIPTIRERDGYPVAAVLLVFGAFHLLAPGQIHFAIWFALVMYMTTAPDTAGGSVMGVLGRLLDSRAANWMGQRSYPTYLVHVPLIQLVLYGCATWLHLGYRPSVLLLALSTPVLVFVASDLLHRQVERRGIAVGRTIAARLRSPGRGAAIQNAS